MSDWLSEIEARSARYRKVFAKEGLAKDDIDYETDKELMARVIREQSEVLKATNPWIAGFTPNGYRCMYCRAFVRFTCIPKGMEFIEQHKEDCIWRNLSIDAKEVLDD